jgi:hypothetical protein
VKVMMRLWLLALALGLAVVPTWANVRYVSVTGAGQYTTLLAAYNASVAGDTILVGPGTYNEASGINQQVRLVWIGAGWDQTIVNLSTNWYINQVAASRSEVQGMRIEGVGNCMYPVNGADSVVIRRCLIRANNGNPVYAIGNTGRLYIEDCVLISGGNFDVVTMPNAACLIRGSVLAFAVAYTNGNAVSNSSGSAGTLELYNNVFLSISRIFSLAAGSQPVIAINNSFYAWGGSPTFGTYPAASTFDYNASSGPAVPGTNGVTITGNPYVNFAGPYYVIGTSDLHLIVGSNLINAGHPSLLDIDGSRSDIGVYGGPKPLVDNGAPNYPWAVNIVLNPTLVGQGTPVNASATGRVGPQY